MFSITVNRRLCAWALPSVEPLKTIPEIPSSTCEPSGRIHDKTEPITEQISLQIEKVFSRNEYKCDICSQRFSSRIERNEHINDHFRIHKCENCAQTFVGDRQYQHHTQNRQCDSVKKQPASLTSNVTIYECYICHKSNIFSLRSLKVHINRLHSMEAKPKKQQYSCTVCKRLFANVYIMRNHMAEIHTNANRFQCTTCNKQFNRMTNLKLHRLIHENKMPCKCQFCGKSFRTMYVKL